ncbi:LacI family DNA-binding transcriptional regulator [Luteimicrobium subarcticum]|uniref:LacI family transcriptional regulator n=1 Tax=Luteimicrobium subarcticum TaxID=620910 RepID=A0A2M8W772_9MICO|nr:LacI family DNA-binding transcriptional regulator [Luteimicrobium subarcticum]PJI86742.1 LacI family transcriptional regulator [Luteimicrobium subarcticum]
MASIDDVARAAGVSTATVSRALRNLPNVQPATRVRVLSVAAELGYVPSPHAATLASGRTRTVGVLTPGIARWFFGEVVDGAEHALRGLGFDVLLYALGSPRTDGPRPPVDPNVLRRRVDGTLVVGLPLEAAEVSSLVGLGVPLAFVGSGPSGQVTHRIDDVAAGALATRHLLGLGHRAVGHVTGARDPLSVWSPAAGRREGWRRALAEAGVDGPPTWVVDDAEFDLAGGRAAAHRLLAARPELTAVFAASDELAMGVVLAARDRGLRVPDDLSVVGVDGHPHGELVGLTTVSQDAFSQGHDAAVGLLGMVVGERAPESVTYPTRLVVRESTSAPRADRGPRR